MIDLTRPNSGLAILTSYNKYSNCGYYEIFDLAKGQLICPRKEFKNVLTSDNVIGLLGVCCACQFAIKHDYIGKIYCSNITTYSWVIKRRYNTKVSSPLIVKEIEENLGVLFEHNFSDMLTFWIPQWGHMRDHIENLK